MPTATPTASATPPVAAWLQFLNRFREEANLPPLAENRDWTQGEWLHSRYMVKEDHISHSENTSSPWYTVEGDAAGHSGNIYVSGYASTPDESAIRFWMAAPFHAVAILDPQLATTGFSSYRESIGYWNMGATLDWQRGLGVLPPSISFPITFPRPGGETWLREYYGGEWPDPLSACPGYVVPTGSPLLLQLGSGSTVPQVTAHAFYRGGNELQHCVFDETSYVSSSASSQSSGRAVLNSRDAIVLMPRDPLQLGETYTASITTNGTAYSWTFTVVAPPQASVVIPAGMERAGAPLP